MKIFYCSGNILVTTQMGGGASSQILGFISGLQEAGHQVDLDLSGDLKLYPHIRTKKWLNWLRTKLPISWLAYEALQILNNRRIRKRLEHSDLSHYDLMWQRYELFTTAYTDIAQASGLRKVLFIDAPLILERQMYGHLWLKGAAIKAIKHNVKYAEKVVAISEETADYIYQYVNDPSLKVYIFPNGFSHHILNTTPEAVQQVRQKFFGNFHGKIIGFVGSPMTWHRLDYLVQTAHRLKQSRQDFRVLIIGEGPDSPAQQKLVADLGLQELVKFSGIIPFAEIAPYLHALDIGVIPASNLYGSPMKITEYMACGLAVVAPDLPPIAEFCTNEVDALLFPKDDLDAFCNCIQHLLDSSQLLESLREKARRRAQVDYSWSARIKQLENILST